MMPPQPFGALRSVRWLLPGLGVKRWLILAFAGALLIDNGVSRWFVAEGAHVGLNEFVDNVLDDYMPLSILPYVFAGLGAIALVFGLRQWLAAIVAALAPQKKDLVDALLDRSLRRGYKIVAIGGGTGLSTLLRGLKRHTTNLTAIVTVTDDGGSSGRLQKELGILPPGDIRNCLVALADDEAMVTDLFKYRFNEGEGLSGHSFGNLFLAAMTGITGNFDTAIKESSRVLNIKGRVLPATLESVRLCATLRDGTLVRGETTISASKVPIDSLSLEPGGVEPLREALEAIRRADAIVLGPGSLYTSILPNFLVNGIAEAVARSSAIKIYICNVMTQPGETDAFAASQHVAALFKGAGEHVADYVVVNEQMPTRLREAYAQEGQIPVEPDRKALEDLGVRVVGASVISETATVRHDPQRLAEVVLRLIDDSVAERSSFVKLAPPAAAAPTPTPVPKLPDEREAAR
jgi:uncharacterized cofD-like protein